MLEEPMPKSSSAMRIFACRSKESSSRADSGILDNGALGKLDREPRRYQPGGSDDGQDPRHDRTVPEQQRRQVHRKSDVLRPIQGAPARTAKDRFGELPDERALLRNGYEAGRENDTQFGMQPTGERFEFHQRSGLEVNDRLIIRHDLAAPRAPL